MRRINGSTSFDRLWQDYAYGFGELSGEFWLGIIDYVTFHRYTGTQLKLINISAHTCSNIENVIVMTNIGLCYCGRLKIIKEN